MSEPSVWQKSAAGTLKGRIEAILFVSGEAVSIRDLSRALGVLKDELLDAVAELDREYEEGERGFIIKRYDDTLQLSTRPLYAPDIVRLLQPVQRQSLSQAVMETLAIVAYKQPITKAEMEQIRGVKCDYSVQVLVNRGLIEEVGRKDALGRPILYGTTTAFLQHFGIEDLNGLPPLPEAEPAEAPHEGELVP